MDTQISNSPPFSEYLLVWGSISLLPFSDTNFEFYQIILQRKGIFPRIIQSIKPRESYQPK